MQKFYAILEANWTLDAAAAAQPAAAPAAPVPDPSPAPVPSALPPNPDSGAASSAPAAAPVPAPEAAVVEDPRDGGEDDAIMVDSVTSGDLVVAVSTDTLMDTPSHEEFQDSQTDPGCYLSPVHEPIENPSEESEPVSMSSAMLPPSMVPEKKRVAADLGDSLDPYAPGLSYDETARRVRARILLLQFFGCLKLFG